MVDHPRRIIGFSGGHNFRDMGGYRAGSGLAVAWGKLYRSGSMVELSDADHDLLHQLELRLICDLRSTRERRERPSRLPDARAFEVWWRDHRTTAADVVEAIQAPGVHDGFGRDLMIDLYRELPYEQAESYKVLFSRIAAGDLPLVFHCTAGKDRTGVAAAVLLDVLGVPRDVVAQDYALTDRFFDNLKRLVMADPDMQALANSDPRLWEPLLRADPAYLDALFATIDTRHGSSENYLREVLELAPADVAAIRETLLVPADYQ